MNAALIGVETVPGVVARSPAFFGALHVLVQALFVAEIAVRIAAHGRRVGGFFRDGWNLFDFGVVALSLLPVAGPFATVARLARILRVARAATALPDLRLIIGTMLRSIPSLGHVVLLLGLLFYIYGVVGFYLFGVADPVHWGSLPAAARTLFQILTLEGRLEVEAASRVVHPASWLFYSSHIVVAVFVVTNLFIAVVINNLETVRAEEAADLAGRSATDATEEGRVAAHRTGPRRARRARVRARDLVPRFSAFRSRASARPTEVPPQVDRPSFRCRPSSMNSSGRWPAVRSQHRRRDVHVGEPRRPAKSHRSTKRRFVSRIRGPVLPARRGAGLDPDHVDSASSARRSAGAASSESKSAITSSGVRPTSTSLSPS